MDAADSPIDGQLPFPGSYRHPMRLPHSTRTPKLPATSTRRTLSRQWELLKLLPNRAPGITASEIQTRLEDSGHNTSKRTVERDLIELSQIFPLQCNDKGTPYGWYWTPGQSSELPGITLGEALTLRLVEDSIRPLIPGFMLKSLEPRFSQARHKLQALSAESASARWVDKVASVQPSLSVIPPEVNPEHLETVQTALLDDTQIACRYYAAHKDQTHELTLNPLGLIQRGQVTYLVGSVEPFDDVRLFVLHRFVQAKLLGTQTKKPTDFNLQSYIDSGAMQFGIPRQIQLRAWVNDNLARLLNETPLSTNMILVDEDEGATITATVNDTWELKWWILSHAGSIQVQEPLELRRELREKMASGLRLHESD